MELAFYILIVTVFIIGFLTGKFLKEVQLKDAFYLIPRDKELTCEDYRLLNGLLKFVPRRVIKQCGDYKNYRIEFGKQKINN